MKMINYKPVKVIIDIPNLAKVIINVVVRYHDLLDLIVTNKIFFSSQNSGYYYTIFLTSNKNCQSLFIIK